MPKNQTCIPGCIAKHDASEINTTAGFCYTTDGARHGAKIVSHDAVRKYWRDVDEYYRARGMTDDDSSDDFRDRTR
jgi:hypothetical protein